MEEEEKGEIFQTPTQFESRMDRTRSGGSKKYIVIAVIVIVVILLIFGVFKLLGGSSNSNEADLTPTPTATEEFFPTEEPLPTEEAESTPEPTKASTPTPRPTGNPVDKTSGLDRSELSIRILNGSGVSGAAKKASDYLEGLGYNVIQIGNSEKTDYEKTEIQIKSTSSKYLDLLKKDLSTNYSIGSTSGTPPSDEAAEAIIIIGKE